MDHSWGRGVTEEGTGDTGATLCTRLPQFGPNALLTNEDVGAGFFRFWIIRPDMGFRLDPIVGTNIHHVPHFPYGWTVPPDVPL